MGTPVRYPNGVTNVAPTSVFKNLPVPSPTALVQWFDDFHKYTAGDWTVTSVETGTGDATEAVGDAANGILTLTTDDADNDATFLQWGAETFTFETGKKLWFEAGFAVGEATQSEFVMGLQVTDTTPLAVANGVFFQKDDGDTNIDFHVIKASADAGSTAVATATTAQTRYAFYYDGKTSIEAYVGGVKVATVSTSDFPTTELTISFGYQNGEAGAATMSVDYIYVAKER